MSKDGHDWEVIPANWTSEMRVERDVQGVMVIFLLVVIKSCAKVLRQLHRTGEHGGQDLVRRKGEVRDRVELSVPHETSA